MGQRVNESKLSQYSSYTPLQSESESQADLASDHVEYDPYSLEAQCLSFCCTYEIT